MKTQTHNSHVPVSYMYERVHDLLGIVGKNTLTWELSRLHDDLAKQFEKDTGTKIGAALGWNND